MDIGVCLLLEYMIVVDYDYVVDLGCGNGVFGFNVLLLVLGCKVIFVDELLMVVELVKDNVVNNF